MSKEYFSHDYNARNDPKLTKLKMVQGMDGIGIYWCIIEMLYEQGGYISLNDIDTIAFELHTQCECITSVLKNYHLFKFTDDKFYSESVLIRLELRADKSKKTSSAALTRWAKYTDAMQMHSKSNAIKGKERKGNKKKVKEFTPPFLDEVKTYFNENGYSEETAVKFYKSYSVANWIDSKGNPVKNWKQKAINVWFKEENLIVKKEEKIIPVFRPYPTK